MYGFDIIINGKNKLELDDINYNNIICKNHMIKKFEQDKIFCETAKYIIILDGVILNRIELIKKHGQANWENTLIYLYEHYNDEFFSVLRGSFAGAFLDKEKERWIIFGDQIGSRFIYYSLINNFFCCSERVGNIYDILKNNDLKYNLDTTNSLLMLTYGFMIDDRTICKEIHKINPGCYIIFQNGNITEKRYYILNNDTSKNENITEEEAIEKVDILFRNAVKRQFEKDLEAGYNKHLVALSGGLDCRMTSFVAHYIGYTQQLNMTFSQTDYWDEILPKQMSRDLKHEWIFKALDNGLWLYDADNITQTTGGNVIYYGTAHGDSMLKYLNFNNLGLFHSGQIGDVVIGSFIKENEVNKSYELGNGAYSNKYLKYISNIIPQLNLNKEIGLFYYRAFNGTNNGLQNVYNYTETLSPFLDLDFIEGMLSLPIHLRQNHNLYIKWILNKYPKAAEYIWETTGLKINPPSLRIKNKIIPYAKIPHILKMRLFRIIGIKQKKSNKKANSMNPIEYYYHSNNELQNYINSYFIYIEKISDTTLKNILLDIKKDGTAMEKIQAVTLLSAIKMYY